MSKSESPPSINEYLSTFLDDEIGSFEERRLLDELKKNQNLSKKLTNYALIGESLRAKDTEQSLVPLGSSFLNGIQEKISLENDFTKILVDIDPTVENKETHSNSSWFRPIGGFAIAASVGALAFMGLQNVGLISNPGGSSNSIVNNSIPVAIVESVTLKNVVDDVTSTDNPLLSTINDQYENGDSQTRSLLKRYVDSHMQYASSSTFVPSIRAIAFTDNQ